MKVFEEVICPVFCVIQNRFVSSFRILAGIKKLFFGKKTPTTITVQLIYLLLGKYVNILQMLFFLIHRFFFCLDFSEITELKLSLKKLE